MPKVAVVAGASGFVGENIVAAFAADGFGVRRVGRRETTTWDDPRALTRAVDGADLVVNLAGKSVNCRYTDANRDAILSSRLHTTRAVREAIGRAASPPPLWLNASTATIDRHETERPNTERDGVLGSGFSVDVARAWEREPAMWVLRTEPELVLKSRWVVPGVLADAGFVFTKPYLDDAI